MKYPYRPATASAASRTVVPVALAATMASLHRPKRSRSSSGTPRYVATTKVGRGPASTSTKSASPASARMATRDRTKARMAGSSSATFRGEAPADEPAERRMLRAVHHDEGGLQPQPHDLVLLEGQALGRREGGGVQRGLEHVLEAGEDPVAPRRPVHGVVVVELPVDGVRVLVGGRIERIVDVRRHAVRPVFAMRPSPAVRPPVRLLPASTHPAMTASDATSRTGRSP